MLRVSLVGLEGDEKMTVNVGNGYQEGDIWFDGENFCLPHQCDQWTIGTSRDVETLMSDLRVLLAGQGVVCRDKFCDRLTVAGHCGDHPSRDGDA